MKIKKTKFFFRQGHLFIDQKYINIIDIFVYTHFFNEQSINHGRNWFFWHGTYK